MQILPTRKEFSFFLYSQPGSKAWFVLAVFQPCNFNSLPLWFIPAIYGREEASSVSTPLTLRSYRPFLRGWPIFPRPVTRFRHLVNRGFNSSLVCFHRRSRFSATAAFVSNRLFTLRAPSHPLPPFPGGLSAFLLFFPFVFLLLPSPHRWIACGGSKKEKRFAEETFETREPFGVKGKLSLSVSPRLRSDL